MIRRPPRSTLFPTRRSSDLLKGPWLAEGWATPLASSVTVPDATEVPVQVLEVVKNVNVTVPVGVPKAPARVAIASADVSTPPTTASILLSLACHARALGVSAGT